MPVENGSEIVSFDGERACEAAMEAVEGPLYSFVEFTIDDFHPLYVADETLAFYEDEEQMMVHFSQIHDHASMDFMEIELFRDQLFPISKGVRYIATGLDYLNLVRVYARNEGVFFAISPDEPVLPVVKAVRAVFEDDE